MPALTPRIRWLIGGGAVVAAVAVVVGAIVVLGARPAPAAMTYIPRDSVVVAELRPDFPGDQLSKVGNLLAHFPGYKDQSILGQKLDETLAKLTKAATNGTVDYATQVKPWLAGPLYAGGPASATSGDANADYVVVFTTDGTATCAPFTGTSPAAETYRGLTIHEDSGRATGACAIDGRQAVVGSVPWVKAALDAHATNQGIDGLSDYRAARDRLGGDRLATLYIARAALTGRFAAGIESALPTLDPAVGQALDALPAWVMAGIRAEDDALVADVVSAPFTPSAAVPGLSLAPGASLLTAPPAHASRLATIVPGDTALLYEVHGAGISLQNLLTQLRSSTELAPSLSQVDSALGLLGVGSAQALLGSIDDAGIVIVPDGSTVTGGLVLLAADEASATDRAAQLVSLVNLAKTFGGLSVSVSATTIAGTTVTLVDLGDLSRLLGPSVGSLSLGGIPIAPGTHVVLSIASHGSAVLIGSGEAFARRILETTAGSTLADQPGYKTALGHAAAQNDGQLYVAAAGALAIAEPNIPSADKAAFESDVKPYLSPFDAILETTTTDSSGLRIRLVITVR